MRLLKSGSFFRQTRFAIILLILCTDAIVSSLNASCTIESRYLDLLLSASLGVKNVKASVTGVSEVHSLAS